MNIERRFYAQPIEVRAATDAEPAKIVGYGAVFDSRSENLGGFTEIIEKGAFDNVLNDDVRGLFNHDPNFVLGRNSSGTMKLSIDETGLRYEIMPPDTQIVRDLVIEPMTRGDVSGSSFGFIVDEDEWSEDDDGAVTRTIKTIRALMDVGPVTFPAYPDTGAAMRSLNEFRQAIAEGNETLSVDELRARIVDLEETVKRLEQSNGTYRRLLNLNETATAGE